MNEREQARKYFEESGLSYKDIGSKEWALLLKILQSELDNFKNEDCIMTIGNKIIQYNEDGYIHYGRIDVDSVGYFEKREGITFNTDGFIGLAGWADDTNVKPFVSTLIKWTDKLKE